MIQSIRITGIGSQLQGVGRLEDGRAVFVPGALPGEQVKVQITRDGGRFCEASLVDVLEHSSDRSESACPHAGLCGGCQARHMRYEYSLQLKRQVVYDALTRIGGIVEPIVYDTIGCDDPDRARNKAEYPIDMRDGRAVIGAFARDSHAIVPLKDCLLQKLESVQALCWFAEHLDGLDCARHLKYLVTRVSRKGGMMLTLSADAPLTNEISRLSPALFSALPCLTSLYCCQLDRRPSHALDGACTWISGARTLTDALLGLDFELAPQAFFQVNPPQAERLYLKALEAAGIAPGCGLNVLDAYCGAGTITLAAARWADHATGIEIVPPAIENARRNAAVNSLSGRVDFICGDAAREIPRLLSRKRRFDAVILDPPRKGADAALLDAIADSRIPTVAYVSCDPATLARDVKRLSARGYALQWAQPVDMFPWTGHVETVVLMSRKDT